jgi:23S rRNA-intervening sequence protein
MNLAEGFLRNSLRDFARYLRIANCCAEETGRWTQDGIDRGHYAAPDAEKAFALADRTNRLISGLIASLERIQDGERGPQARSAQRRRDRGPKTRAPEPREANPEPSLPNPEVGPADAAPNGPNPERARRTQNRGPRTQNPTDYLFLDCVHQKIPNPLVVG